MVAPKNQAIYGDHATHIEIDDQGAGEYVAVSQPISTNGITINTEEWGAIRDAIDEAISQCRPAEDA
jgi:hypothetical protein